MYQYKSLILLIIINLFTFNIYGEERFICTRLDTNEVVNFYISENKLYLSGLSISGTYSMLTKYTSGLLAINMSNIGNESGAEVIFLDFSKKTFSLKSNISNNSKNSTIEIKGNCK